MRRTLRWLSGREWVLGLAPQELVGRLEGVVFMLICLVALALVTAADVVAPAYGTVGAIALLPVGAAAWLLSWRLTLAVVLVAMALQGLTTVAGAVHPLTAGTQLIMIPVLAFLARLAATRTLRAHEKEIEARTARAAEVKARELERAKSEFLRLASHELRGPVAILRGYLTMIEEGALGALPPPLKPVLPILTATADGMNHTVDQMLDTARLEDSRLQLKKVPSDLAALVRESATTVHLIHGQSHPVLIDGCELPVMVCCDPARIRTVVGNLVSNAVKYSPAGSEVAVRLHRNGESAEVSVTDRGIGIPDEALPRLFTRFGRIDSAETAGIPGTGLGLYLARELARLHGGDLRVASKPKLGSTFTLSLPVCVRTE